MKIGITGTHSTGKTTLLNALRSEPLLRNYEVCDEVTRQIKSWGFDINEAGTDVTQRLIMMKHIENIVLYEDMITDRTVLDGLVYTRWLFEHDRISSDTFLYAEEVFDAIWDEYDYMFWLRPEFALIEDGVRSNNLEFRKEIDHLFDHYITTKNLNVVHVTGSVRERINKIIEVLDGK